MMIRSGIVAGALVALVGTLGACSQMSLPAAPKPAVAPPPLGDVPVGWDRNLDGSYKQAESGVLCPRSFGGFGFTRIEGPASNTPNVLGTCFYSDGQGRVGTLRVRRYDSKNDQRALAANDKALMATDGTAPRILLHSGIDHNGGSRVTATVARRGLLVDCSVWQAEHETPRSGFPGYCTTLL